MKNLLVAMRLEIRACMRQLAATVSLNTLGRILLVAFAVLMSAALGYLRLTGLKEEVILTAFFAASALLGGVTFNRRNAVELLHGEKTQALRTLPMPYRTLRFVKLEKVLFASALIFGAVSAYSLVVLLLAGYGGTLVWMHTLCALAAFCLMQNLRALLLGVGGRKLTYPLVAAVLCALAGLRQGQADWIGLLEAACGFYVRHCAQIALVLLGALLLVKWLLLFRQDSDGLRGQEEVVRGISPRMERLLGRMNEVTRRDLREILHSEKECRSLWGRILLPALAAWVSAVLFRTGLLPVPVSGSLMFWMMILLLAASYAKLFERQMTMGYEGGLVLAYLLSGRRISDIQGLRLRGSLVITTALTLSASLATALILGQGARETVLGLLLGAADCAAINCASAYYLVKGTSYQNDMNRPRLASSLTLQAVCTGLEMLAIIPLTLLEYVTTAAAHGAVVALCAAICALTALVYARKIRKGDAHFYGEYQSVV